MYLLCLIKVGSHHQTFAFYHYAQYYQKNIKKEITHKMIATQLFLNGQVGHHINAWFNQNFAVAIF